MHYFISKVEVLLETNNEGHTILLYQVKTVLKNSFLNYYLADYLQKIRNF